MPRFRIGFMKILEFLGVLVQGFRQVKRHKADKTGRQDNEQNGKE
jgi:hypothetical protein